MKKFTSFLLSVLLILSLVSPGLSAPIASQVTTSPSSDMHFSSFSKTAGFHFDFLPAGSIWKNLIAGQTPARLQATYTLKEDVVKVGADFDKNIKAASQLLLGSSIANTPAMRIVSNGAFISKSVLESASGETQPIQPDTVFVNETTGTAFKVVVAMDGDEGYEACRDHYAVTQPQIHEVVEDFTLPPSDVALNQANITSFAGLPSSTSDSVENYIVKSGLVAYSSRTSDMALRSIDDPLIEFAFPEGTELKATAGGQNITVKVSGGLAVGNLGLEAKYSGFSGYYFALKIAEEAYLNVDVGIDMTQEVRIPILGIDVPFGIGRVSGGLFVIVGLDGKVTIQMEAREYIASKMGVKGDTFMYAPVSCKPFFSMPEKSFDGDVQVDGKINGYVKAGALLSLEIFGWDLVGAGVFIGSGVNITSLDGMLDIELYGLVQVYITFAGDTYYLLHFKPTLLRKQQKDMGGYRATIDEVCAYQDIVVGYLQKSVKQDGNVVLVNASNAMFDIVVTDPNTGVETFYPKNGKFYYTDPDGRFLVRDYPDMDLNVNDRVGIRVYEGQDRFGPSKPISATYPFSRISITAADAFNDWIEGQVEPSRVRNWDKKPGEEDYEMLRFTGEVGIDIQTYNNQNYWRETLYTVHVTTDENGFFRAENGSLKSGDPPLDFKNAHRFTAFIDQDNALVHAKSYLTPYTKFVIKTISETVPGSSVRFMEGSDTVDQIRIKTRIYVVNMGGSRQLTGLATSVALHGLSTQDRGSNGYWAYDMNGEMIFYGTADGKTVSNAAHNLVFKSNPAIQIEASSSIQLLNDQTNGTSYVDLMLVKEWVWPAHTNPTVITSPDHTECTTEGGTFQVTATGEEIIQFRATPSIPGVVLTKDGSMTMAPGMSPGVYQMTIEATANHSNSPFVDPGILLPGAPYVYSEDPYPPVFQAFTLTVLEPEEPTPTLTPTLTPTTTPPTPTLTPTTAPASPTPTVTPTLTPTPTPIPVAPTITSARTVTVYRPSGGSFQVTADGTLPITYSLSPLPDYPDMPVPVGVTIDENTGSLTIAGWTPLGTHYFGIVATNIAGQDEQTFMLVVKNLFTTIPRIDTSMPGLHPDPILRSPSVVGLSANLPSVIQPGAGDWLANLAGAPEYVLRNDDPKDLYSQDMLYISGAEYVKYDLLITFTAEDELYAIREFDTSPCNNHHAVPMTEEEKQAIEDTFKNRKLLIEYDRFGFGPDLESRFDSFLVDQWTEFSVLDYGSMIGAIDGLKSGNLSIGLGGVIGTIVPGSVFNALQGKSADNIGLSFGQEGATMTFMSGTVNSVEHKQRFDLAFSQQAVSASAMKEATQGAGAFTFAFAHNDALPGFAQFDIVTDLAAGQSVNVYKYDAQSQRFSTIAENVVVAEGGVVTYMNNTMSEYLITTAKLEGAETTEAYRVNNQTREPASFLWAYFVGGGVLLLLVAGGIFLLIRRNRKVAESPGDPSL